ncbi:hypothetical protein GGI12_001395 [Dipsacomyces acuminosporus]|nr:hypothetical protein GGI12_001395 [Dipsacomyces acuminosporus]
MVIYKQTPEYQQYEQYLDKFYKLESTVNRVGRPKGTRPSRAKEGALLGEHATPLAAVASSGAETRKHTRRAASDTLSDIELPGSPVKRRRDSLEGTYVHGGVTKPTLKSRKLSKALSNQFARSLSMSSNHNRNGSYSESPEELGAQIEHNSPFGCESVSPLSSTHSSTSSLSSTSLLASNSSAWRPSESPFAAGTISAPALMLNRALVYPASSRSLKSQEKSKLPANRSLGTHLHQGSRSSMDLDHSDSNAQSTGNESINAITPVNDDVFGELLRPIPQDVFNSSTELIDVAVQRWAMMQTAYTEESPAQLVESLQQRIARLEELVPFVTQQALGEQRYSSIYHQYSLQGERLREFCQAISEITSIGEWLYQRQFQLLSVVLPALPPVLPSLQQVMQLVRINEDMNNLVLWTPEFSASLAEMTREYEELVAGKRAIYGDIISQCGLRWKAVGLPVDEVLLLRVRQWMESTAGSCVSRIARAYERRAKSSSAFGKEDITTDGLVQCGSQLLHAVAISLDYLHKKAGMVQVDPSIPVTQTNAMADSATEFGARTKEIAMDICRQAKKIDSLIEALPGIDVSESEQEREFIALNEQNEAATRDLDAANRRANALLEQLSAILRAIVDNSGSKLG